MLMIDDMLGNAGSWSIINIYFIDVGDLQSGLRMIDVNEKYMMNIGLLWLI